MNPLTKLLSLLILFALMPCLSAQNASEKDAAALVNGEIISQKVLWEVLEASYGKDAAESLNYKVIQAILEEMVIFKVMEQNLKDSKIVCTNKEYLDSLPYYEQPFFLYFKEWGFKNPVSFSKTLQAIAKKSPEFYKQKEQVLEELTNQYPFQASHYQSLENIWQVIVADAKLKKTLRSVVFEKYYVNVKLFQEKIKIATKFHKYASSLISDQEVEQFAEREKLALEGGAVRLSHLLFFTIDRQTNAKFSPEQEAKALAKAQTAKALIKPDLSNFAEIAKQSSEDDLTKLQGGDLGWVPRWTAYTVYGGFLVHLGWVPHWTAFVEEIVEQGYRLGDKKLSDPVKTKLGYHLIMVTQRKNSTTLSKDELLKKARAQMAFLKMEALLRTWLEKSQIKRSL